MASAASDNAHNRQGKLEETEWEKEIVRNRWVAEDRRKFQKLKNMKNKSETQKSQRQ